MAFSVLSILFLVQNFFPPPGTTSLSENRFIDEHLVTYEGYNEFLYYIGREEKETQLNELTPSDTTVTYRGKILWGNEKFLSYPIIGLDRAQITKYCAWRSSAVNSWKNQPENRKCNFEYWNQFDLVDPNRIYEVKYSLPSRNNLIAYKSLKEKYWLDEWTDEEDYERKISKKISNSELKVFRCIAYYEKV